jgi:hypothetical protein
VGDRTSQGVTSSSPLMLLLGSSSVPFFLRGCAERVTYMISSGLADLEYRRGSEIDDFGIPTLHEGC